jgi:hypothetical protein
VSPWEHPLVAASTAKAILPRRGQAKANCNRTRMTRIERIYADFLIQIFCFGFIREDPLKSDVIRVPLPLIRLLF